MATSPQIEVFWIYSLSTGAPLTGQTGNMSFSFYADDLGVAITPQPTITEVGGGAYKFTPAFAGDGRAAVYTLHINNVDASPAYVNRLVRKEDWYPDLIARIQAITEGHWKISTVGADANTLTLYDKNGTTVLQQWSLFDNVGLPTTTKIYERRPTLTIP